MVAAALEEVAADLAVEEDLMAAAVVATVVAAMLLEAVATVADTVAVVALATARTRFTASIGKGTSVV